MGDLVVCMYSHCLHGTFGRILLDNSNSMCQLGIRSIYKAHHYDGSLNNLLVKCTHDNLWTEKQYGVLNSL